MAKPRRTSKHNGQSKQSRQTGGTFLGIVLGLIVGLAIAVIVALYITRAPTPFVAKVAPPPSDNASQSSGQPYDPNRPLQGKTPGQAVPQAAQPTPPNTAPGQSNNQTQSSGMLDEPQIVEVPGTAAPASTPKTTKNAASAPGVPGSPSVPNATSNAAATPPKNGSQPNASSTAKTTPPAPGDVNTGYYLQVGAYKTQSDAEQQRARLGFQGFESKVTQRDAGGVTYYRVRVGPFAKFEEMNTARQRLSDAGVDTAVIRFSKQ